MKNACPKTLKKYLHEKEDNLIENKKQNKKRGKDKVNSIILYRKTIQF